VIRHEDMTDGQGGEPNAADRRDRRAEGREHPPDPAGTRPRHDPASLLPSRPADVVEGSAVEDVAVQAPVSGEAAGAGGDAPPPEAGEVAAAGEGRHLLPERRAPAGGVGPVAQGPSPFAPRFHFLFGALAAVGAAALTALVIVILAGSGPGSGPDTWSRWRPSAGGIDGARQIAQHVGTQYRFANGKQLVNVEASPLQIEGVPLAVAVRENQEQGGDIKVFDAEGLIYRFCGLGPNCAIASGKPTPERHLLLRREALELSLYSFHYLGDVDQIVVFMPPRKGEKPSQALFFRRGDVDAELERPLTASLAERAPTVRTVTTSPDIPLVQRLTMPKLFTFSLTQANTDNRGFIVLDPLTDAQGAAPQGSSGSSGSTSGSSGSSSGSSGSTSGSSGPGMAASPHSASSGSQ
jgi:hypothetical protein